MKKAILSLLVSAVAVGSLVAGDYQIAGVDKVPLETSAVPSDDFESNFRIDGWIVQIDLGIANTAAGLSKNIFLGFDDIISNLDWIVPIGADFRYKRFGFMPDLVAAKLSGGTTTPGPFYDRADVDMTFAILNLAGYYRLVEQPGFSFDVIGGARYLYVDSKIGLSGGALGSTLGRVNAGTTAKVWDGIVGLRIQQDLSDKLFYTVYGDVGAGTSDLTWQIIADLGYQFTDCFSMSAGYRYLQYDAVNGLTAVDLTASGPQVVFNWKF